MKSIWSREGDGDDGTDDSADSTENLQHNQQPDERTHLLPDQFESQSTHPAGAYLSPDDPAVSPYNLWSVRLSRHLTVFFTLVTFVWWLLMLVSAFITIPAFHSRGSVYFAFAYASVTLANLVFTLIFFAMPAKAVRILSIVMGALLLVDTILLTAVENTRYEEGWIGVTGVLWAFLMAVWVLATDRLVLWGKNEEEERLTGRAETRRTIGEWSAVLVSTLAMVVLTLALVLMTLTLVLRALDAGLQPPGKKYWVDGGNYRMHVYCKGDQTDSRGTTVPTVLLEGGEGTVEDGLWQFVDNAIQNGSISRYCFVDRPGLAWSDTAPSPLSASMAVEAASEALARAGEDGPWVLLGAGLGSIYSRIFSSRKGEQIKGLVLVDPLHEDLLDRIAAPRRGFSLWVRGIFSPLGLDQIPGAIFKGRTKEDRVWGRSAYQTGSFAFAKLQENLVAASLTKRDVASSKAIQDKATPLTVISSGLEMRRDDAWSEKQRDLTHLTRKLLHWDVVDQAPHQVWDTFQGRQTMEDRLRELVYA